MGSAMSKVAMIGLLLSFGCSPSTPSAVTSDARRDAPEAAASLDETLNDSGTRIELDGITLNAPTNWESKPPGSSIIAAEFILPRSEGDDADGRLTISTAGGTVEANIDRWKGQFDPQPQQASQEEIDVAGLKMTVVDYSGDFNDQRGPFAPAVKRADYRMIAAVIPIEGQLHFIKATGPAKTIAANADKIHEFIRSARAN